MTAPKFRVLVTYRHSVVTGSHHVPTRANPAWVQGQVFQRTYSAENLRAAMLVIQREQSKRDAIRVELTATLETWERDKT